MMVHSAPISRTLPTARLLIPPQGSSTDSKPPNLFGRLFTRAASLQADVTSALSDGLSSKLRREAEQSKKKVAWDDSTDRFEAFAQPASPERKPIKSILKPYYGSQVNLGPSKLSPPHTYANLAAMLESVAQQLAGSDRDSKLDAYTTLSGVLRASENVPDVRALKEKMVLLLAFIKRDLTEKTSIGSLDTTLAVNALVLLSIFLHKTTIADSLTTEFCINLVDHAIRTFQDASMSKDIAKHLMLVLAEQKFSPKVMNGDRVSRLIDSLRDIEKYVRGKSIVIGRMNIYRTLLRQSSSHLLLNTSWMHDLFGDILSTVKETRASAITFGLEAGLMLGSESKATRAFMDLFAADLGNGITFGEFFTGRLKANIETKHDVASVPQIWSIPILFLRSKPRQFEHWVFMNAWLKLVQQCFNCSDQQARLEANLAWNRLVFAVSPDEKTPSGMITLLYQPLRDQVRRKTRGKKAALGSLCNLLYYSLKPTSTPAQLDLYWDRYIADAVCKASALVNTPESNLETAGQELIDTCRILASLFDSVTPRKWSDTRAVVACGKETLMDITELPALDSKWLRKNANRVFPTIVLLLEKLYWDLAEDAEVITHLWKAYITSIASPAIMEVKVSNETMSCIACIFGFSYKIWHMGPKSLQTLPHPESVSSGSFLLCFETIIATTISGLGLLPFTEKLLSIGSTDDFIVIATPSHQPRMARGEPRCPLHHLLVLLTTVSPNLEYDRNFSQMVRRILIPFLNGRHSKQAKLDLVLDLLSLLPQAISEPCRMIWSVLADFATSVTDTRDNANKGLGGMSDQMPATDYQKALRILEVGLDLSPKEPLPGWKILFEALVTSATIDAGDSGRAIAVIEPLGRFLQSKFFSSGGSSSSGSHIYFRTVLLKATYPSSRQAFDVARRKFSGTAAVETSSFDPYSLLYDYVRDSLEKAYTSFTNSLSLEYSDMIAATTNLLSHCPSALLMDALAKLQNGIASWIRDEGLHIGGGTALSQSLISMWSKICQIIPSLTRHSSPSKILADLEILLCSGLESRHRSMVNCSIRLWNSSFGASKIHLVCPTDLKDVLLSVHQVAELQLPFLTESLKKDGVDDQRQLSNFADTQSDLGNRFCHKAAGTLLREPSTYSNQSPQISPARPFQNSIPQVLIDVAQIVPQKRSQENTPDSHNRKSRRRNVLFKLRHDDSQVQFQAIDSSPINNAVLDSQLLTDRKKEVKDRQQAEAAMFPDLRSSPQQRDRSRSNSISELPLHRFTAKSHGELSLARTRESTPLTAHVESDDYINSSPTPTRSLHNDGNFAELPSSPPQASIAQTMTGSSGILEIPSASPPIPLDLETDITTSLEPSAQVTNYAIGNTPTLSALEITPNQQNEVSTSVLRASPERDKFIVYENVSTADVGPSMVPEHSEAQDCLVARPNTPSDGRESSPAAFQTATSELFHDAPTSPASQNRSTVNEDVFEDAASSPRPDRQRVNSPSKQQPSSPISYLDESSALRILAGYDQGSGRPRRSLRNISFTPDNVNQIETFPLSPADALPQQILAQDEDPSPAPDSQATQASVEKPLLPIVNDRESTSSLSSLIPDTQGSKPTVNLRIVDGEEVDLDETIIVDDSILHQRKVSAPKRRKRKTYLTVDSNDGPTFKKGKHEIGVEESVEIADCQDAMLIRFSPKKITVAKTRMGRPKRVSSLTHGVSQLSPALSFSSLDIEESVQESQDLTTSSEQFVSLIANEAIIKDNEVAVERVEVAPTFEELPTALQDISEVMKGQLNGYRPKDDLSMSVAMIHKDQNPGDADVVADPLRSVTGRLDDTSSVPSNHEVEDGEEVQEEVREEVVIEEIQAETLCSETFKQRLPAQVIASMQTGVALEYQTFESTKGKLQSVIDDLRAITLRREEVNELEDMFMDAKRLLYGAGGGGKAAS